MTDEQRDLALIKTRRTMKKLNRIRRDLKLPPRALTVIAEIYAGSLASVVDSGYARAVPYVTPPPRFPMTAPRRTENLGIFGTHDVADFSDDFDIDLPRLPLGFSVPSPFPGDCCGVPQSPFHAEIGVDGRFHGGPHHGVPDMPPPSEEEIKAMTSWLDAPLPPKP